MGEIIRAYLLIIITFLLVQYLLSCHQNPEPGNNSKPNFIIILADDMGYGDASCYGGWIETPGLEQLAAEGLKLTDFHSSGVVCSPTRAGLLTGRYQQRVGVPGVINADPEHPAHKDGLDPNEITISKLLKSSGYKTAILGKWHLGYHKKYNPVHHGFYLFRGYVSGNIDYISHYDRMGKYDWWENQNQIEEEGYSTHLITNHAVDFIRDNKNHPFFLYIAHEAVHSPFQAPDDPIQRGPGKTGNINKQSVKETYYRMMVEMDKGINEVRETVRESEIAENTLIFFFSDNGAARQGSNSPLRGYKGSVWEGGHRVPAIAWWPGKIAPGTINDQLTVSLDLMPTILDLANVLPPQGQRFDGISLKSLLIQGRELGNRKLFWNGKAMRDGKWKLVIDDNIPWLYDLSVDINESKDLSRKYPDRSRKMTSDIDAWKQDVSIKRK